MAKMIGKPVKDPKKKKMLIAPKPKRGNKVIGRPVKTRPKKGTPGGGGASGVGRKLTALKAQRDDQMGKLSARAQLKMAQQPTKTRATAVMPTRKPKRGSRDPRKQYMGGGSVGVKHYNSIFDID